MALFTRKDTYKTPFRRNDRVKTTVELPSVPKGTLGKVKLVNGIDWQRVWVFFDNGAQVGSLDHRQLVRPEYWDRYFQDQQEAAELAKRQAELAASGQSGQTAGAAAAAIDPNDPLAKLKALVPPHLLERSAAARKRLGA